MLVIGCTIWIEKPQVEILDIPEPQTVTKDGESYIVYYEWVKSGEFNSNVYRLNEIRI